MFTEFQGEVPGGVVSVCLDIKECLEGGILNSNNHLHTNRIE